MKNDKLIDAVYRAVCGEKRRKSRMKTFVDSCGSCGKATKHVVTYQVSGDTEVRCTRCGLITAWRE